MLLQFNFKNFKSFRDEATLDLTATKIAEYDEHVVTIANNRVLPVAAIYGANASGKSNMQEAFRYMHNYVINSFSYGGEDSAKRSERRFTRPTPFLFDASSRTAESTFEIFFVDKKDKKEKEFKYGFSIGQDGITEEWLSSAAKSSRGSFKPIFYRKGNQLDMPGISTKHQENIRIALQKETLVVSLGKKLKNEKLSAVWNWFYNNEIADFGIPVENYVLSNQLPYGFVDKKTVQNDVLRYFSAFDPSIIDFEIEEKKDDDDSVSYRIDTIHKMIDSKGTTTIPLKQESAGTLKMFALYPMLQEVLNNGGVFFVDELNARLHPLLVRALIITFARHDTNPNHAQLLFTSHDAWLLNCDALRRDEIWFIEKDYNGISSLYSLADFINEDGSKIRKDENFEKNYLLGKYGAIPEMRLFDIEKGEGQNDESVGEEKNS